MLRLKHAFAIAALAFAAFNIMSPSTAQMPGLSLDNTKEVKLTEQLIENFLAAQKATMPLQQQAMAAMAQQMKDSKEKGTPLSPEQDPKIVAAMEDIVKQHGFTSAQDYLDTSMTLMPYMMPLMFGGEPRPVKDDTALKRSQFEAEIADVAKDATLDDKQKADVTAVLKKEYDKLKPIAYPENFDVVMKMKDKIKASAEAAMKSTIESFSGKKAE